MTSVGTAYIAGAFEHPTRKATDISVGRLHAECAAGALADAGLGRDDVDGFFCGGDAPGGLLAMVDYLGLKPRHIDSTDIGGSSYIALVAHAAQAIAAGKCNVALITLAGRPRTEAIGGFGGPPSHPTRPWEPPVNARLVDLYALCARRHMY